MKKLLIGASLLLIGSVAHAAPIGGDDKNCSDTYSVYNNRLLYGEAPIAAGNSYSVDPVTGFLQSRGMVFFLNRVTGTWSIVNTYINGVACIQDYGNLYTPTLR